MQVYSRWNSRDFARAYGRARYVYEWTDFDDIQKKYGPRADLEAFSDIQIISTYFEGMGVLVKRGLIDISLIDDLLSDRIIWWWEYMNPIRQHSRKLRNNPKLYDSLEYLYKEMKKREQQATTST